MKDSSKHQSPKKFLIIRLHAFGDLIAILPYINGLRQAYPDARIDLLTTDRIATIPRHLSLFDRVYGLGGKMNSKLIFLSALAHVPLLVWQHYDHIIDLQHNRISRYLQYALGRPASPHFETMAPLFAGVRYQQALARYGFPIEPNFQLRFRVPAQMEKSLRRFSLEAGDTLIVLNPAGFFPSRNWPLAYYEQCIDLFTAQYPHPHKFLLIGDERIAEKSKHLEARFPERVLNLVGQTTQLEAFALLQQVDVVLSEDSGLAHMSWVQGMPLILLLGSTRADWTAPPYSHVTSLTSSDLPCGDCMQPLCQYGDNRCLSRYTPDKIVQLLISSLALS